MSKTATLEEVWRIRHGALSYMTSQRKKKHLLSQTNWKNNNRQRFIRLSIFQPTIIRNKKRSFYYAYNKHTCLFLGIQRYFQ